MSNFENRLKAIERRMPIATAENDVKMIREIVQAMESDSSFDFDGYVDRRREAAVCRATNDLERADGIEQGCSAMLRQWKHHVYLRSKTHAYDKRTDSGGLA